MSIEQVCVDIIALTTEDFVEVEKEALNQTNYNHPLKRGTTQQMRKIGQHNLKTIKLVKALQLHLQDVDPVPLD